MRRGWMARLRDVPWPFWAILAVAIVLRIAAFDAYATHHPDESIQYIEQAHRLVFGYGVVPWEFRYFIRSWLIPLLVAGPMKVGAWLDPNGIGYLVLPRALIAMVNFSPVIAAWYLGARVSRQHAIVAMAVTAVWLESVLFSVHTLSESMAIACFLPAAAMLRHEARLRTIALAGTLMALAGLLRFQYAPAIAVFGVLVAGGDWRMWKGLLIGGIPVVIGGAAIDLAMGLKPYEWILNNYQMNIANERMRKIGGVSHWTYLTEMGVHLRYAAPLIGLTSLMAGKRYRPLLIAAWVNIVVHQIIGHKEWRYLWFSIQILLVLSAIGTVNLTRMTLFGFSIRHPRRWPTTLALVAGFAAASLALAVGENFRHNWRNDGQPSRLAARAVRDPRVCGLAVNRYQNTEFGYGFVHRPIPLILLAPDALPSQSQPGRTAAAFNAILVNQGFAPPAGYAASGQCAGRGIERVCLFTRPGGCTANADSRVNEYQALLLKYDF